MEDSKEEKLKKDVTGTVSFQITTLKKEIENLKIHLSKNKGIKRRGNDKDVPAKRALLKKVAKVKRFLVYLKRENASEYEKFYKN